MAATANDFKDLINTHFQKGAEVEISSNDDGFRGSWFAGTIIRPIKKAKISSTNSRTANIINKVLVEYKTLTADVGGRRPLREELDVVQLRPPPPREEGPRSFKFSEEVDAYYNDGWWEGVITEVLENERYSVFFRATREQLEFGQQQLRLHREWVNGKWVPPLESQDDGEEIEAVLMIDAVLPAIASFLVPTLSYRLQRRKTSLPDRALRLDIGLLHLLPSNFAGSNLSCENFKVTKVKPSTETIEEKFSPGKLVEVSSDEEGFQGAWFAATVVKQLDNGKYLIEYKCLRNDDDTEFLREEVDSLHIRPCPPDTKPVNPFKVSEEVDALYNDGWWVGEISKVLTRQRYIVYFRLTGEKMEFKHADLRPHQDWIDGKWVIPSKVLKL